MGKAKKKPKPKAKKKSTGHDVASPTGEKSISIRKISNGHVVTESGYKGKNYVSKETFTPKSPRIHIDKPQ